MKTKGKKELKCLHQDRKSLTETFHTFSITFLTLSLPVNMKRVNHHQVETRVKLSSLILQEGKGLKSILFSVEKGIVPITHKRLNVYLVKKGNG